MKTQFFSLLILLVSCLCFTNCSKNSQEGCMNPLLTITKIEPASNPTGYEIRIIGNGFTANTIVRFDNSTSGNTEFLDASTLIATIPAGVLGAVEVSASEEDCIARNEAFSVYADFPGNIPFSPNFIIIPQAAITYPANSFQDQWTNIFDEDHKIFLEDDFDNPNPDGILKGGSTEFHNGGNVFFDGNPITGHFRFDSANKTSDILIRIDRSAQTGGELEVYTAVLIDPASVGSSKNFVILLTSQKDGRQLVFESS